jgi:hypothetical protein
MSLRERHALINNGGDSCFVKLSLGGLLDRILVFARRLCWLLRQPLTLLTNRTIVQILAQPCGIAEGDFAVSVNSFGSVRHRSIRPKRLVLAHRSHWSLAA